MTRFLAITLTALAIGLAASYGSGGFITTHEATRREYCTPGGV